MKGGRGATAAARGLCHVIEHGGDWLVNRVLQSRLYLCYHKHWCINIDLLVMGLSYFKIIPSYLYLCIHYEFGVFIRLFLDKRPNQSLWSLLYSINNLGQFN